MAKYRAVTEAAKLADKQIDIVRRAKAGSRVVDGMRNALDYAKAERAVHDWIREDAPLAAKMNLRPEHVTKLIDRLVGSTTVTVKVTE